MHGVIPFFSMKMVLLLTILFTSLTAVAAPKLRIFSMNLHCGLGDWKGRMDVVVKEILELNPDIIGLQEVCYNDEMNMTDYILRSLQQRGYPVTYWITFDTHRSFIKYQEQLLMISKKNVTYVKTAMLPSLIGFENGYIAILVDGFWAVTSHLHFLAPPIRTSQYKVLAKVFSSTEAVLFGDLNSNPQNGETHPLKKEGWFPVFNGPTYPSENPQKTFDGFWFTKSFSNKVSSAQLTRLFLRNPSPPSDHLGIVLNVSFRKPK